MKIHIVQKGDTLYEIAHAYGVSLEELMEMNQHLSDPNMLMPGMKIHIPANTDRVQEQGEKKTKQEKKMEKKTEPVTERRPRHHVEMDDHQSHKVPSSQERPIQPMLPQAMPMPSNPPTMRPDMQMKEPMIYCCCCNQYHQMVPIQPFKDEIEKSYQAHQPNLRPEYHVKHPDKPTPSREKPKLEERQTTVINETYFTNDAIFY